jgi:hypothetical protein
MVIFVISNMSVLWLGGLGYMYSLQGDFPVVFLFGALDACVDV